jgi:uncharacterized protein (TIGR02246 family)
MTYRLTVVALLAIGCATKAPEQAAAPAPPLPDSATVRTALNALADQYEAAEVAGDPAQVAALFTDDARTEFQGFPAAVGRAAIEEQSKQAFAAQKVLEMTIETQGVNVVAPAIATAGGIAIALAEVEGKKGKMWWRWAGAYRNVGGQWKFSYLMAFQDSTQAQK